MAYYSEKELHHITIDNFLEHCPPDTKQLYLNDVEDPEYCFTDARFFLQGSCQIFAHALQVRFGYKIYCLTVGHSCHYFCKTDDEKTYIDVRGCTSDFDLFIAGLYYISVDTDTSVEYNFTNEDKEPQFNDIISAFADYIIGLNPAYYCVEKNHDEIEG